MKRRFLITPFCFVKFMLFTCIIFFIFTICYLLYLKIDKINIKDDKFTDYSKCPYCYGSSYCEKLKENFELTTTFETETYFQSSLFNIKNVFYGVDKNNEKIVIKKLAHNEELNEFDDNEKKCRKNNGMKCISKLFGSSSKINDALVSGYILNQEMLNVGLGACITDRITDLILETYKELNINDIRSTSIMLLTTFAINPEPITLQLFPEEDGWPFPKYHGACGRLIFESYKGKTLDFYIEEPFEKRVQISLSLLESLEILNENKLEIGVYYTDYAFHNLAYDEHKKRVYFIDTEDLVLTDKKQMKKDNPQDWNLTYYIAKFEKCGEFGDCLSIDFSKICDNYHVDLNYYAACRNILSPFASDRRIKKNFLHSIPNEINLKYELDKLLRLCADYDGSYGLGRFELAKRLISILKQILSDYKNS